MAPIASQSASVGGAASQHGFGDSGNGSRSQFAPSAGGGGGNTKRFVFTSATTPRGADSNSSAAANGRMTVQPGRSTAVKGRQGSSVGGSGGGGGGQGESAARPFGALFGVLNRTNKDKIRFARHRSRGQKLSAF